MESLKNLTIAIPAVICACLVLWWWHPDVAEENHLIESAQVVLLILAAGLHAREALRIRRINQSEESGTNRETLVGVPHSSAPVTELDRRRLATAVCVGGMLLALSFAVRELDIQRFGRHPVWGDIEIALRAAVVACWVGYGIYVVRHLRLIWDTRSLLAAAPVLVLTMTGCLLYLASWPFDKQLLPLSFETAMFIEETIQLNACIVLVQASGTYRSPPPKRTWLAAQLS